MPRITRRLPDALAGPNGGLPDLSLCVASFPMPASDGEPDKVPQARRSEVSCQRRTRLGRVGGGSRRVSAHNNGPLPAHAARMVPECEFGMPPELAHGWRPLPPLRATVASPVIGLPVLSRPILRRSPPTFSGQWGRYAGRCYVHLHRNQEPKPRSVQDRPPISRV
jgi:hypothetical protein